MRPMISRNAGSCPATARVVGLRLVGFIDKAVVGSLRDARRVIFDSFFLWATIYRQGIRAKRGDDSEAVLII